MRFAEWTYVYVAGVVVVLLAIAFALDFTRRRRLLERIGHAPQLSAMASSVSLPRRALKAVLIVLGVALIAFALARPQIEGEGLWHQRGIDVALVMDFSKSMLARDVYPSRVERVKDEAEVLMNAFSGSRVAVIPFAGAAVHYPLTTDYEVVKNLMRGVSPLDMAPGSDIGEAIRLARCVLRPDTTGEDCQDARRRGHGGDPLHDADKLAPMEKPKAGDDGRARAIVIFTDGEDTEGSAKAEVEKATKAGVLIFFVGVGTPTGERIPEYDQTGAEVGWKLTPDGKSYVITKLDEESLKELAKAGGGGDHYFPDDPKRVDVEPLVGALRKLKEGEFSERVRRIYDEAYAFVLFPGFLALLIESCISERKKERRKEKGA